MLKWLLILVIAAAAVLAVTMWAWSSDVLKVDLAELEATYATEDSKFMEVDGVRMHYLDQGEGPVVVLLHASFMHMRTWDSLAKALAPNYRVIRMDFLLAGLTGPEPNDEYTFDRNRELVHGLTEQLNVDKFAIIATSSGGIVGFNYAAQYPERVSRLVLINSAGMPRTARTNPNRARGLAIGRWFSSRHQTKNMLRETIAQNFIEPHEPPEWLVDMNYDMRRRVGLRENGAKQMRNFRTGDPETVLAKVTAPTLLLWGLDNQTVVHLEADVFEHWLTAAPTIKKKYPSVGHYLYMEIADEFEADIADFLAGKLDSQLRFNRRIVFQQEPKLPTPAE
jgi:pimeloyl-ACP methyl ester carboxylesterase